jgi:hypothetical protein
MRFTRRRFLADAGWVVAGAAALISDLIRPFRTRAASGQVSWSMRRATYDDLAALRDIFNEQRNAGLFPFTDLIEPWTEGKAAEVLDTYTGTQLLSLGANPIGFVAFVDYTRPETASAILPEADPEVQILAVRVGQLTREQRIAAVKRLALAVCRDFQRQGFQGCEAMIHARTGFQDLFADRFDVKNVNERDGVAEAKQVRFRIGEIVADFEAEGL